MKLDANPELIINNLINQIAKLSKENAFYLAALTEIQERIKDLENKIVESDEE